ncbi:unnamed protein product [Brassica oleracea]
MEEEEVLHISSGSKQISMDRVEIPQLHEHPLVPFTRFEYGRCEGCSLSYYDHAGRRGIFHVTTRKICKVCQTYVNQTASPHYKCQPCGFVIHVDCVCFSPEAYHTSHRQHPVNSLKCQVPDYADKKCLLCAKIFDKQHHQLHHCDVCNLSICRACMKDPPPVHVECLKTHEHQLHLVPRRINFTCNACGTQGGQSPYFCLLCNYMIHRECIDLPCVININRHDHHISYTPRLGHGEWKCKEGTPEKGIIAPFEVIDDSTIKNFSHDDNLQNQ